MEQYEPDAVLVRFDRVANGKEEIRELMGAYLARAAVAARSTRFIGTS